MNKPIKPNITIPQSFAENGVKTDFDDTLLADGFDSLRPDVLAGDNLNKFIDDTYKGLNYGMAAADAINLINEGETLTVKDGKLSSGSIGEDFVKKTGDTMTGNLRLNSASLNIVNGAIYTRNSTYALDDTASTAKYEVVIQHEDKNNVRKTRIESAWLTDGSHVTAISEKKSASENSYASIQVGWDKNGTAYATAPTPATGDNSTKIATTAFVNNRISNLIKAYVTQTYNNGTSGYRVWSDGYCEQWGAWTTVSIAYTQYDVTLLRKYNNTNYSVSIISSNHNEATNACLIGTKTVNSFVAYRVYNRFGTATWKTSGYLA